MPDHRLRYFADPMCSWCYGFGPALDRLVDAWSDRLELELIPGGLAPHTASPMGARMARETLHHWEQVERASGQPFDHSFFETHPGFVYNTEPACRGVVTALTLADTPVALAFHDALQRRFYAEGHDPTSLDTLGQTAAEVGLDADRFAEHFGSPRAAEDTRAHFESARDANVTGYPTLHLGLGERSVPIAVGCQAYEDVHLALKQAYTKLVG